MCILFTKDAYYLELNLSVGPANTQRNKHVTITSKSRFDLKITSLLRFVFAGDGL